VKTYKIKSYAKINLYLEVLKKRKDHYHQILTLFERINLSDQISIRPRADKAIRVISTHPDIPKGKTNLAYRAADFLKRDFAIEHGVDIKIDKRIPVAAGLGGGSSNAAGVLLLLNRLWKLRLKRKELIAYAKKLGADVPFFLTDTAFALGLGRGDDIQPLGAIRKKFWHVLVVPKFKVSTQKVYLRLDKILGKNKVVRLTNANNNVRILIQRLKQGKIPLLRNSLFNRLQMSTLNLYPRLNQLKNLILDSGLPAIQMSSSGPAMYGIFSSRKEASARCSKLSGHRKYDTFTVRTC
jgi:4-diphosphocytidyl-2-C-methyl-D-erythritol kinase